MLNFLILVLELTTPLILAVIAGYASERGGLVNIALEGKMLIAAFACAVATPYTGPVTAVAIAIACSTLASLLHWLFTHTYKMDQIVSGMAINLLAVGVTGFFKELVPTKTQPILPLTVFYVATLVMPLVVWWMADRTRFGLQHRSVGSDPSKAKLLGIQSGAIRAKAMLITGLGCGLAGAFVFSYTANFTDGMTAGRGFIALAALILGGWRPLPACYACIVFGVSNAVDFSLRGKPILNNAEIPSEFLKMIPYVVTLLALAGFLGKNRTPTGLGKL